MWEKHSLHLDIDLTHLLFSVTLVVIIFSVVANGKVSSVVVTAVDVKIWCE